MSALDSLLTRRVWSGILRLLSCPLALQVKNPDREDLRILAPLTAEAAHAWRKKPHDCRNAAGSVAKVRATAAQRHVLLSFLLCRLDPFRVRLSFLVRRHLCARRPVLCEDAVQADPDAPFGSRWRLVYFHMHAFVAASLVLHVVWACLCLSLSQAEELTVSEFTVELLNLGGFNCKAVQARDLRLLSTVSALPSTDSE